MALRNCHSLRSPQFPKSWADFATSMRSSLPKAALLAVRVGRMLKMRSRTIA